MEVWNFRAGFRVISETEVLQSRFSRRALHHCNDNNIYKTTINQLIYFIKIILCVSQRGFRAEYSRYLFRSSPARDTSTCQCCSRCDSGLSGRLLSVESKQFSQPCRPQWLLPTVTQTNGRGRHHLF